jgi:arylsulfatase A-like enzyme
VRGHPIACRHGFIIADDLGYGDLGCFGHPEISTPHLDKLAKQGVKLDRAYSAGSVCSPTRVGWATGRYPGRLPAGLPEPIEGQHQARVGLDPSEPTLPRYLKDAGYRTALFGKWHLGYPPNYSPVASGFDEYWGVLDGGCDYFTHNAFAPNPGEYRLYQGTPETNAPAQMAGSLIRALLA